MPHFKSYDVLPLLGLTPIAKVTDAQIWRHLLTPQVRALLGDVQADGITEVRESVDGSFPGDDVTNLNNHRLFGGSNQFVRFPYISTFYRTAYGALVIKRDGVKIKALGFMGDAHQGRGEMIYKVALRDRRFDGTPRANDCSLLDFPMDDPRYNQPLPFGVWSLEVSIYGFMPGSRISQVTGDQEYEDFIANPFTFLDKPERFLELFQRAWTSNRAPGMIAAPIPDVSRYIGKGFDTIARLKRYDFLEDAASHYHVAMFARSLGYRCTYSDQDENLAALTRGIQSIKDSGIRLTRPQESWVCVIQSLRPVDLIPKHLYLNGPVWQQDNISQENLWMNKPLTARALELIPGPTARARLIQPHRKLPAPD